MRPYIPRVSASFQVLRFYRPGGRQTVLPKIGLTGAEICVSDVWCNPQMQLCQGFRQCKGSTDFFLTSSWFHPHYKPKGRVGRVFWTQLNSSSFPAFASYGSRFAWTAPAAFGILKCVIFPRNKFRSLLSCCTLANQIHKYRFLSLIQRKSNLLFLHGSFYMIHDGYLMW